MLNKLTANKDTGRTDKLPRIFQVLSALLFLAPLSSAADTIFGVHASAHVWMPELSGEIGQTTAAFDFSSDFDGGDGDSTSVLVAIEHPIPVVPNFQFRTTPLEWTGASESASGTLGGVITINGAVDAALDIDSQDGTLYYEVLDNWVSLDLGLTGRFLDGFVEVQETNGLVQDRLDIEVLIPMLYGHARFDLPFSGLAAGVRGNAIAFSGSNLIDLEAYLQLDFDLIPAFDVGIQGGFRRLSLELDDVDDLNSDAALDGAYIALTAHF